MTYLFMRNIIELISYFYQLNEAYININKGEINKKLFKKQKFKNSLKSLKIKMFVNLMFLFNCICYFLLICDFKSLNKYENRYFKHFD